MTNNDRELWLKLQYPLTVVADRYGGCYSGDKYIAFPLHFDEIPPAVRGDDVSCATFWGDADRDANGLGETPEAAFQDLKEKMARAD